MFTYLFLEKKHIMVVFTIGAIWMAQSCLLEDGNSKQLNSSTEKSAIDEPSADETNESPDEKAAQRNNATVPTESDEKRHRELVAEFWKQAPRMLEEILEKGTPDSTWQKEVLQKGMELLREKGILDTTISDVSCSVDFCKIVFVHDNLDAYKSFSAREIAGAPWNSNQHGRVEKQPDGTWHSIVFFSKIGTNLPLKKLQDEFLSSEARSK